jgi:hypothetical protein
METCHAHVYKASGFKSACAILIATYRLGQGTGLGRGVLNLVVEDGEVEGEAQADRVGRCHL